MQETRVSTWTELHESLFAGSWDESIGRFRSQLAFRGLSCADWDLRTSLMRLGRGSSALPRLEAHLLRNFRKYAHREAAAGDSIWNWMAVAQHHGLPTRLIDWTFSPYVALHFATTNLAHYGTDGVIWCVNYVKCKQYLPRKLKAMVEEEGFNVFTVEMLSHAASTIENFDCLSPEPFALFLEPPSLDARIVNQYALFSMMSSPAARLDEWLERQPGLCHRIIVPAPLKWEVRDKLDQANINERSLFPGLDGLSQWLKRHYTPAGTGTDGTVPTLRRVDGER